MIAAALNPGPPRAALWRKARAIMDVILHIGAHRTGTTTFQRYMRSNAEALAQRGIGFWGPRRTRDGLLAGLVPKAGRYDPKAQARALGRVHVACDLAERRGVHTLIVSDENMMGTCRNNVLQQRLYPGLGERLARYVHLFAGRLGAVVMSVRGQDAYWASAMAMTVPRGIPVPDTAALDRLVTQPRSWRDVITEAACAVEGAPLRVAPFETFAGRPDGFLRSVLPDLPGGALPQQDARGWHNRAPRLGALRAVLTDRGEEDRLGDGPGDGRWRPFDASQAAALQETYADDMFWLRAGADGLAEPIEDQSLTAAEGHPRGWAHSRGQENDIEERALG